MPINYNVFRRTNDEDVKLLAIACAEILLHEGRTVKDVELADAAYMNFGSGRDITIELFDKLSGRHKQLYGKPIPASDLLPQHVDVRIKTKGGFGFVKTQIWDDAVEFKYDIVWCDLMLLASQDASEPRSEVELQKADKTRTRLLNFKNPKA